MPRRRPEPNRDVAIIEIGEKHEAVSRAHRRFASPSTSGQEPARVSGLDHTARPVPSAALATQIDQGCGVCFRIGGGGPPSPCRRANAIFEPSGDHRGDRSLLVDGAT